MGKDEIQKINKSNKVPILLALAPILLLLAATAYLAANSRSQKKIPGFTESSKNKKLSEEQIKQNKAKIGQITQLYNSKNNWNEDGTRKIIEQPNV